MSRKEARGASEPVTNYLDALVSSVEDPDLASAIRTEVARLRNQHQFGLVFERHIPERVRLYSHPVRKGLVVQKRDREGPLWTVLELRGAQAHLIRKEADEQIEETVSVHELVVVREFGEAIYPGLQSIDRVERGGDKPFHVVINAENYHALELLLYTAEGTVDVIYIDPPYNKGNKDWKYNNHYVDSKDTYRHSKWLAFMERRLALARRLLNPADSVMIVTIDEKEVLRLGMLLEQMFPEALIQMATSVISAKGTSRARELSRVSEHLFLVMFGSAAVGRAPTNMLDGGGAETAGEEVEWLQLRRREPSSVRGARPNQFYPIFVNLHDGSLHSIGDPLPEAVDRRTVEAPAGTKAFFPLNSRGREMLWGLVPETLRERRAQGYFRLRNWDPVREKVSFQYLQEGTIRGIQEGRIEVEGRDHDGSVRAVIRRSKGAIPKTVWNMESHNAETQGTALLSQLVPGRRFDYPKSLYAVEDVLRIFVQEKPHALVVDFFAGSGTTTHAVARLNRQDGGRRRSISVTNNEVSVQEARTLTAQGLAPGHPEWEQLGVATHITWPRVRAALTGSTHEGQDVEGEYKFNDEFLLAEGLEENAEFFNLTYLDRDTTSLGAAFASVAPMLWLKGGAQGPRVDAIPAEAGWVLPDSSTYGILLDPQEWKPFARAVGASGTCQHVYVVTDSVAVFQQVVAELPSGVGSTRLYEDYLTTFEVNTRVGLSQ